MRGFLEVPSLPFLWCHFFPYLKLVPLEHFLRMNYQSLGSRVWMPKMRIILILCTRLTFKALFPSAHMLACEPPGTRAGGSQTSFSSLSCLSCLSSMVWFLWWGLCVKERLTIALCFSLHGAMGDCEQSSLSLQGKAVFSLPALLIAHSAWYPCEHQQWLDSSPWSAPALVCW